MADAEGEEEQEQPWVPDHYDVSNALSELAKTEDGSSVVYTRLDLKGFEGRRLATLQGGQFPITLLENVRHLDICNNKFITEISEAVGQMERLLSLKASGNSIGLFEPSGPMGLAFLQTVDLSNNKLTAWVGLESPHLRYLNLSNNQLSSVSGLGNNPELQTLLLANNKPLTSCAGLGLSTLRELSLTDCGLESLDDLSTLVMSSLDLTNNALKDLAGLSTSGVLKKLVLNGNPMESLDAVDTLVDVGLTDVRLPEIPEAPADLRVQVIKKLWNGLKNEMGKEIMTLNSLNGAPITPEEIDQVCSDWKYAGLHVFSCAYCVRLMSVMRTYMRLCENLFVHVFVHECIRACIVACIFRHVLSNYCVRENTCIDTC